MLQVETPYGASLTASERIHLYAPKQQINAIALSPNEQSKKHLFKNTARTVAGILGALGFLLTFSVPSEAARFSVCNRGDNSLYLVRVIQERGFLTSSGYRAEGRWSLPSGECHDIHLRNYQWAYVGVFDRSALTKIDELLGGKFDQNRFDKLSPQNQSRVRNALFPYRAQNQQPIESICANKTGEFEYMRQNESSFGGSCPDGYFRVPIIVRSRGGDNNAVMNLK